MKALLKSPFFWFYTITFLIVFVVYILSLPEIFLQIAIAIPMSVTLLLFVVGVINLLEDGSRKIWRIKEGKHRCGKINRIMFLNDFKKRRYFEFNISTMINERGLNKLWGYSIGILPKIVKYNSIYTTNRLTNFFKYFGYSFILPHHWNSIRAAWNFDGKDTTLFFYTYSQGIKNEILICSNELRYKPFYFTITKSDPYRYEIVYNDIIKHSIVVDSRYFLGYELKMYINEVTNHEITVPTWT